MTCFRHGRAAATVALAACLSHLAAVGQGGQVPQTPTFRSRVTLVPIDVRVLDRNGRPVTDLTKDDFTVAEDGVPQQISHFERQALVAGQADAGVPLVLRKTRALELRPQERRVFLIVLGRYWLPRVQFGIVEAITRFLRERLLPQDYAAVCAWNRATDVTTDHDAVAQVVERLRAYQLSVERSPDYRAKLEALYNRWGKPTPPAIRAELDAVFQPGTSVVRSVPQVTSREISGLLAQIENHAAAVANAERPTTAMWTPGGGSGRDVRALYLARGTTNAVLNVFSAIQYLRYIEGEKHVIYFTPGGLWLPALEDDRDLARIASDARVVIHVTSSGGFDLFASMSSKHVAELTGGQAFMNQYPDRALARIEQATRVGYLLGYYPSNGTLDGRHRKVKVTVKRPSGATVLYRHSYQATDEPAPYDQRRFIVQDRIMTAGEYGGEIRDITVTLKASARRGAVTADALIDLSRIDLQQADGRHAGTLEVAFFCTDSKERLVGQVWQTVDLKLKEDTYARLLTEGLHHTADIAITGSARYVKVVVYDYLSDRLGSAIVRPQ